NKAAGYGHLVILRKIAENSLIHASQFYFSSGNYFSGNLDSFFQPELLSTIHPAPAKGGHMGWRKTGFENVGSNSNHRSRIELSIYGGFGMIAHDESAELQTRIFHGIAAV